MDETFLDPVLPFAVWKARRPTLSLLSNKLRNFRMKGPVSQPAETKWTYNPLGESLSSHEFYTMQPTIMNQNMRDVFTGLFESLGDACSKYQEFQDLSSELQKLMKGPEHIRLDVCVIGGTGIGKSTFINAILNRPGLASASDATKACTQHATTYEFLLGAPDDTKVSNVKIILVDILVRKKETQEHIDHYAKVHCLPAKEKSLVHGEDEVHLEDDTSEQEVSSDTVLTEEDYGRARTAFDYFCVIWKNDGNNNTEEDLIALLETSSVYDGTLLRKCLEEQEKRINELGKEGEFDRDRNVLFKNIPDKSHDTLDLSAVRALAAGVWPLVSKVHVATGGPLLRNGLAFTDLPGYGDLNQDRIAIANAFRRRANCEIVVGEGLRLEDSKTVHRQIRNSIHAHSANNTMLVVNKLDQHFQTSEEEVQLLLDHSKEASIQNILKRWAEMANMDDIAEIDSNDYGLYLYGCAESVAKRLKANDLKASMHAVHGKKLFIHVVSSQSWIDWLDPQRGSDPKFGPKMSGIHEVQKTLLEKVASANFSRYRLHFFVTLPKIENQVLRILKKSAQEKGFTLCHDEVLRDIQEFKTSRLSPIWTAVNASVTTIFTEAERTTIEKKIKSLVGLWRTRWAVRWNTWNMTLRTNGIPHHSVSRAYAGQDVNWNRDLLQTLEQPMQIEHEFSASKHYIQAWKDRVMQNSEDMLKPIRQSITTICKSIEETIRQAPISQELMYRTLETWDEIKLEIESILQGLEDTLNATATQVYRDVTTEEDVGCTIAKITKTPFFQAHGEQLGTGSWGRQHNSLRKTLATFVRIFEDTARMRMKKELRQAAINSLKEVSDKLELFLVTVQAFFETDANHRTKGHVEARRKLRTWLQTYSKVLEEAQSMFPERARGHSQPSAKRTKLSYDANMEAQVSSNRGGWSIDLT